MTWRETGYIVVTVIAFIASVAVPAAFETSGLDRLYFTKLTWHSVAVSMGVLSILVRWLPSGWKPRLFRCISNWARGMKVNQQISCPLLKAKDWRSGRMMRQYQAVAAFVWYYSSLHFFIGGHGLPLTALFGCVQYFIILALISRFFRWRRSGLDSMQRWKLSMRWASWRLASETPFRTAMQRLQISQLVWRRWVSKIGDRCLALRVSELSSPDTRPQGLACYPLFIDFAFYSIFVSSLSFLHLLRYCGTF